MNNAEYLLLHKNCNTFSELSNAANNIANNTPGFKTDIFLYKTKRIKDVDKAVLYQKPTATIINWNHGGIKRTNSALDVAIKDGNSESVTLFGINTKNGVRYTRNGNFRLDNSFKLVDVNGNAVLSADGSEIFFNQSDVNNIIMSDGAIISETGQVGKIGLFSFHKADNIFNIVKSTDGYYEAKNIAASVSEEAEVIQGALEESNISYIAGMQKLLELQNDNALINKLSNDINDMRRRAYDKIAKL